MFAIRLSQSLIKSSERNDGGKHLVGFFVVVLWFLMFGSLFFVFFA